MKLLSSTFHKKRSCPTEELPDSDSTGDDVLLYCSWHVGTVDTGTLHCNTRVSARGGMSHLIDVEWRGPSCASNLPPAQAASMGQGAETRDGGGQLKL